MLDTITKAASLEQMPLFPKAMVPTMNFGLNFSSTEKQLVEKIID